MNRILRNRRIAARSVAVTALVVVALLAGGCGSESEPNTLAGDVATRAGATRTPPNESVVLEEQEKATERPAPTATNTARPSPTATAVPPTATQQPPTAMRPPPTPTRVLPTAAPPPTMAPPRANCHASYPDFCIPPAPPDLDCGDIGRKRFTVLPPDPHRFDADNDGIGCES